MALTDLEVDDLRSMYYSGAFGMPTQQGLKMTKEGGKDLASKSDEEVRAMIIIWKGARMAQLNKQIQSAQEQLVALNVVKVEQAMEGAVPNG